MTPELHGISRMTNVICPVAQMGRLTAELAEAERLRGRPWLVAVKWGAEHLAPAQGGQATKSTIAAAPTFLAAAAAVLRRWTVLAEGPDSVTSQRRRRPFCTMGPQLKAAEPTSQGPRPTGRYPSRSPKLILPSLRRLPRPAWQSWRTGAQHPELARVCRQWP
jgi:hypothetical protein